MNERPEDMSAVTHGVFMACVTKCTRCGEDHDNLIFSRLRNGGDFTHWTMCPKELQPIVLWYEQ